MAPVLEEILEKISTLAPEEKEQRREALSSGAADERARRAVLIHRIKREYAGLLSSVDDFCARKDEEIVLEDRPGKL